MAIDQAVLGNSKGKEVVVADKKGKAVVELNSAPKRPKNYDHFHEDASPTHFCKVILAPKLESLPMPLEFTNHFIAVPEEFKLITNTDYAWRVTVWMINGRLTFDKGWAPFTVVHQIKIGYLVTIKLATPNTLKMIVFNDDDVEVVPKCKKHKKAFAMDA